jgi:hypothetical protein
MSNRTSPPKEDRANTKTVHGGHGRFDANPFFRPSFQGSASNRPSRKAASAGSTFLVGGFRLRRVALAEPSLPYAKIKRPVWAKSRVPVECGGEDRGLAPEEAMPSIVKQIQRPQNFHGSQKRITPSVHGSSPRQGAVS